jgi:hypothetical protein
MKECPKCRRLYTDASLNFCRIDGERLVSKAVGSDEAVTARFAPGKLDHRSGPIKTNRNS